ncbi:MAG TPA: hypothetical protein ENJ37_01110 [Deltaproteobacteria bacterium]|nr:hypothetical protein [Deltaproteobacteria bacterium]
MLDEMRKRRNSVLVLLAFAAIVIVFIFWGVGPAPQKQQPQSSDEGGGRPYVAMVDGEIITPETYRTAYDRQLDYFRNTYREQFNDEFIERLDLRRRTVDMLINRTLILKKAEEEGVSVSDDELQKAIMNIPAFQKDGVFDKDRYFAVLNRNRIKPADFERDMKQDLVLEKMRNRVIADIDVTDDEIKEVYMRDNRKLVLDYISVDASAFTDGIEVTDDEAKKYLDRHSMAFMEPTKVRAFYARLSYDRLAKEVEVPEEEVKSYYEKNIIEFQEPKEVRASHILIRPDETALDRTKARDEARARAEDILKRLRAGEDFAELAIKYSKDPGSSAKGGDLGFFRMGTMVKPFEDAAFALGKGELSDIVETTFGFHIIKVTDIKDARLRTYNEVKDAIAAKLAREKAESAAAERIEPLAAKFREVESIDELRAAAEAEGIETFMTDLFSKNDGNVELVADNTLREVVFSMAEGETSDVVETPLGVYVVRIVERVEEHLPPYEEVADKVKERLRMEKAREKARTRAAELLQALREGADFDKVASGIVPGPEAGEHDEAGAGEGGEESASAKGLSSGTTEQFTRVQGFIPGLGIFVGDKDAIFELSEESPYYGEVLEHGDRFFIFKFKEMEEADEAGLERWKDELRTRLLLKKRDEAVLSWINDMRSKAEIKINEELL